MTGSEGRAAQGTVPVCYRHPQRETYITCTRCDRPICPDCMRDAAVGYQCPECVAAGQRGQRQPRTRYGAPISAAASAVTLTIIGLNVLAFLVEITGNQASIERHFALYEYVVLPDGSLGGVARGEYYRLVTSMFLHVGWLHIALNMYLLWLLGFQLESLLGRWRFIALYLVGGLGGSALSYLTGQGGEGASGAIFALFAAYYIFMRQQGRDTTQILLLIGINLVLSFTIPGIGYWAHLGGLAAGGVIAVGYAYAPARLARSSPLRPVAQLSGVVLTAVAVVVVVALHTAALQP
ncbi:MAG TPA: rhomboid family intramembrane serine protease [Mycobacteriales bacterium]|nr:rhomboid family intramembrane serine protease [Mycobacteriales bacterium]